MRHHTDRKNTPELPSEEVAGKEAFRRLERIEYTAKCLLVHDGNGKPQGRDIYQNGLNIVINCPEILGYEKEQGMRDGDKVTIEVEKEGEIRSSQDSARAGDRPSDGNIKHEIEFVRRGEGLTFKLSVDNVLLWESNAFLHPNIQVEVLNILQLIAETLEANHIERIRAAIESEREGQSSNIATVLAAKQSMEAAVNRAALDKAQLAIEHG